MDMIDVIAKVIYKDKEPQIVGSTKLKKSTCYIANETANSKLILWQNNIDDIDVGEVYSFNQQRLRRDEETVVLNSTIDTVITKKLDSNLTNLETENFTPSDESMELSLKGQLHLFYTRIVSLQAVHSLPEKNPTGHCFSNCSM